MSKHNSILDIVFRRETDSMLIQLFRYGIVGGISFIFDFGALYFFTEFIGLPYLLSAAIGFMLGLAMNYLLSVGWVFHHSEPGKNSMAEFIGWFLIGIAGLGLNTFIIWFFTEFVNFYYLVSKIISTIIVFLWNFFARKYLISKL